MQILSGARDEIAVQVIIGWWNSRHLLLHDSDKTLSYFVQLVTSK